jgi:hypothetical protein
LLFGEQCAHRIASCLEKENENSSSSTAVLSFHDRVRYLKCDARLFSECICLWERTKVIDEGCGVGCRDTTIRNYIQEIINFPLMGPKGWNARSSIAYFNENFTKEEGVPSKETPGPSSHLATSSVPLSLLVGLHCCGGLCDVFLSIVRFFHLSFIACPCCYSKVFFFSFI